MGCYFDELAVYIYGHIYYQLLIHCHVAIYNKYIEGLLSLYTF